MNQEPIIVSVNGLPANCQPKQDPVAVEQAVTHIATAVEKAAEEQKVSKAKGDCPNCGRHFDKGLHLHMRACKSAA